MGAGFKFGVEIVLLDQSYRQLGLLASVPYASALNRDALVAWQVGDLLCLGDAVLVTIRRESHLGAGRAALFIIAEVKQARRVHALNQRERPP